MKVIVLGAGVVGVTTAYHLAQAGCEVTVIDRQAAAASETSYGNAGLITPGDSFAWASPAALKTFVTSLYKPDMGIKVKLNLDPRFIQWTLKFLGQCTDAKALQNTERKLRLAVYAREQMAKIVAHTGIEFDRKEKGVLYFYRSQETLDHGVAHMKFMADQGLPITVLDRAGLVANDPGLKNSIDQITGGILCGVDQTGDSCKFSRHLAAWLEAHHAVNFQWNTTIKYLDTTGDQITRVVTDKGDFSTDAYILTAGCDSPLILQHIGVKLPLYPVKGYSITAKILDETAAPIMGGVDDDKLIAYSRLGDRLRVACTAEFAGWDRSHKPEDFKSLLTTIKQLFPGGADYDGAERWAGLRPMMPSSVPVIGRTKKYANLLLNTGHGHVGWTMSCGSGKVVTDLLLKKPVEMNTEGLIFTG